MSSNSNATISALAAQILIAAGICGGRVSALSAQPVEAEELPEAICSCIDDEMTPIADGAFDVRSMLVVHVTDKANRPAELHVKMLAHQSAIKHALLCSPALRAAYRIGAVRSTFEPYEGDPRMGTCIADLLIGFYLHYTEIYDTEEGESDLTGISHTLQANPGPTLTGIIELPSTSD